MSLAKKLQKNMQRPQQDKVKLLISDESPITGRIEKVALSNAGFQVELTSDLKKMMDLLSKENFDIAILDFHSYNGLGIYEIEKAKKISYNQKIKFIVTGTENFEEIKDKVYSLNSDLFLPKPMPRTKIIEEIKKLTQINYRRAERVKYKLKTIVRFKNKETEIFSIDISTEGIHLADREQRINPYVGNDLEIEFFLPQLDRKIIVKGTVVRITEEGFGVKFQIMSLNDKKLIEKFIFQNSMEFRSSHYYL
ncbi:PilZ domain-containing protein [Fluviispira multicolorata]|uniref:Response regulator n=1 Tax=Fluviispira multicolorata TaxID=2654512 RepID=A0A833JC19_9BACT|nr:response regulator [Fluviispira multicolorata]KAB8029938.1 response regulator [Fluviispira multicolorata]